MRLAEIESRLRITNLVSRRGKCGKGSRDGSSLIFSGVRVVVHDLMSCHCRVWFAQCCMISGIDES